MILKVQTHKCDHYFHAMCSTAVLHDLPVEFNRGIYPNPTCQTNKVKYTCGFQCQGPGLTGGSVFAVGGCVPLKLPEENLPEHTRLLCATWAFVEVSVQESQPDYNKTSTKSIGWGSGQYQENNLGNMLVRGVRLMLPHTSSVFSILIQWCFSTSPLQESTVRFSSLPQFLHLPVSHLFLMPFFNHPSEKQTIFFSALSSLHHVTGLALTASSESMGLQDSQAWFQANNHELW